MNPIYKYLKRFGRKHCAPTKALVTKADLVLLSGHFNQYKRTNCTQAHPILYGVALGAMLLGIVALHLAIAPWGMSNWWAFGLSASL